MFEKLKQRYQDKFCTKEQLQRFVALGKLTQAEYEDIIKEVDGEG